MENHPEIRFVSTSVDTVGTDQYRVTGDLTIKGVTKPVTVDFDYTGTAVDPYGNKRIGLEGQTTVNRKDWGVNWNAALDAGGVLVGEKVVLEFDVSAIRTPETA
jgi:polyisoprenoid-binding protein YceI